MQLHFTSASIIAIEFYCKNPSKGKRDTVPPIKMDISYKTESLFYVLSYYNQMYLVVRLTQDLHDMYSHHSFG